MEVEQFCLNTLVSVSLCKGDANHVLRSAFCKLLPLTFFSQLLLILIIRFPPTDNVPNKGTEKFNV